MHSQVVSSLYGDNELPHEKTLYSSVDKQQDSVISVNQRPFQSSMVTVQDLSELQMF